VPNNVAASSVIHNYELPDKSYGYWIYVSVDSRVPSARVMQLLTEATLTCKSVLKYPPPVVRFNDASTRPYRYMVYVYFHDFPSHWAGKSDLFSRIETCLQRAGITQAAIKYEIDMGEAQHVEIRTPDIPGHLQEIDIFKPLSLEDINTIAGACTVRNYHAGDMIIEKNDTDKSLFIIASGVVSVFDKDGRGQHIELARLSTNECFGEMSLLTGEPRSAVVQALTPVETINVSKEALEPVLKAKPELSEKLAEIMVDRRHKTEAFIDSRSKRASQVPAKSYVVKIRAFFGLHPT
jgi:CRP-like cAMP-binding protein